MNSPPRFGLKLLGPPAIHGPDGVLLGGQAAQRHRIALLALLVRSPERGMSREKLLAYLWPESDPDHARNLLNVSVYVLRKALGEDALLSGGDHVRLNLGAVRTDVVDFEDALLEGDRERAAAAYEGPFLDGFFLSHAPDFERWVDRERDRLAGSYGTALETLAEAAEAQGDPATAAGWWKRRAAHDPYDSRVARRLMMALDAAGNPAAAIQHASVHARLLEDEFGVGPDPETRDAVDAIRQRLDSHQPRPERATTAADPPAAAEDRSTVRSVAASAASPVARRLWPDTLRARGARVGGVAAVAGLAFWGLTRLFSPMSPGPAGARIEAVPVASATRPVPPPRSIAVLPFVNLSPDPEEEYFSDGLAEELIGALARIGALRVAARTSSFAFKEKPGDIRGIGEALNVGAVLEGSVRRDGDRVLVTAQLIDVADGFHLWSETYERRFTEIFDLQRDLALRIAGTLEARLTPGERERLAARPTEHVEAYTAYLRGRHFWNQRTPIGLERAIEYFQRAIAVDPRYSEAYAGLSVAYSLQGLGGAVGTDSARQLARTSALRAIELDAGNAEAHTVLGLYLHVFAWDAEGAEREFRQSIALDPNHAVARQWYGNLLSALGRLDEAVEQKQRAVELDPLAPALSETLAMTLVRAGRLDEAERHVANALELDSTYWRAHAVRGLIHEMRRQSDDAILAYERANALARAGAHRTRADIARVLARSGRDDEARHLVGLLRAEADATGVYEPSVATALLALGARDAALDWLEAAIRHRHPHLPYVGGDARFAGFEGDPRFGDLMRRVGVWR